MNSTTLLGVATYAAAVRAALDDLPDAAKRTVLDGLDDHLAEIVAEGDANLNDILGPPARYAAELRATAGFPSVTNPLASSQPDVPRQWPPPPAPSAVPAPTAVPAPIPRSDALVNRARVWLARSYLGLVGLLIVGLLIANAMNLDGRKVVLAALIVAALWWVGRRAVDESRLPETWKRRGQAGAGGAALIGAVMIGGQLSETAVTYYSTDTLTPFATYAPDATAITVDPVPSTALFATVPVTLGVVQPGLIVPNLIGMRRPEAIKFLDLAGFNYEAVGDENPSSLVVRIEPEEGTVIDPAQGVVVEFRLERLGTPTTMGIEGAVPTTIVSTPSTSSALTTVP